MTKTRQSRGATRIVAAILVSITLAAITMSQAVARASGADRQDVVIEFIDPDMDLTTGDHEIDDVIGWARLVRRDGGLKATVHLAGLRPGGVFTFWWVVIQNELGPPGDRFVASGAGAVIGKNGRATVHMSANTGQESISGAPFLPPDIGFLTLNDPLGALVRVELAYHGQVSDAGNDLNTWLSDFWTGTACPTLPATNLAGQPFCPVYIAATHAA